MKTAKFLKVAISAIIAGAISYIGAMLTVFVSLEPGSTIEEIGSLPRYIAGATAALTTLKDMQAALKNFED